jgi:transposase
VEYTFAMPVMILIHSGTPNDSKLFDEILKKLKTRRIIRNSDILIFDKGYYNKGLLQL